MAQNLARHGSEAGYNAERKTGNICDRCRKAHRVYARQYRPQGKAQGLKYSVYEVIDGLYRESELGSFPKARHGEPRQRVTHAPTIVTGPVDDLNTESSDSTDEQSSRTTLGQRLTDGLRDMIFSHDPDDNDFVFEAGIPEYLHPVEPDPEPADGQWEEVPEEEYVINAAGMRKIEENLGTYLSVVGMTVEMIDPYCGPILAENFDKIVGRWSKVIARYPSAAKLFLDTKGGTLMTWMSAIQATWPVLYAIYEHHLAKTVRTENGRVMRLHTPDNEANGHKGQWDNLQPDNFNYSAQ
jgi:hypothetical protein